MTNIKLNSEACDFDGGAFFSVSHLPVNQTTHRYVPEYRNINKTIIFAFFLTLSSLFT
jgi:hypothetical protein